MQAENQLDGATEQTKDDDSTSQKEQGEKPPRKKHKSDKAVFKPLLSFGPSHNRSVQYFDVTIDGDDCAIGWIGKGRDVVNSSRSRKESKTCIVFLPRESKIAVFGPRIKKKYYTVPAPHVHRSCSVRCVNELHSGELEWYVNGKLVAAWLPPVVGRQRRLALTLLDGLFLVMSS